MTFLTSSFGHVRATKILSLFHFRKLLFFTPRSHTSNPLKFSCITGRGHCKHGRGHESPPCTKAFAGRSKLHYEKGASKQEKRISETTELFHIIITERQKSRRTKKNSPCTGSITQDVGSKVLVVNVREDDRNPVSHLYEAQDSEISRKRFFQMTAFAKTCAGLAFVGLKLRVTITFSVVVDSFLLLQQHVLHVPVRPA